MNPASTVFPDDADYTERIVGNIVSRPPSIDANKSVVGPVPSFFLLQSARQPHRHGID